MNASNENNRSRRILAQALEPLESRRLLSAGNLDPTFGSGGKVVTDINGQPNPGYAMAVSGGKVYLAGSLNGDFVLARYNANGTLDDTFGDLAPDGVHHTGYATVDFGSESDEAYALAVQADGKVVLAGQTDRGASFFDFAVARFDADGSLDTTFGDAQNGKVCADFDRDFDKATGIAIRADGSILVTGTATVGYNGRFALLALTSTGTVDTSFGAPGTGLVTTEWANAYAESAAVALQPDGRIVLAGYANDFTANAADVAVARYNPDGSLDGSFGAGGLVKIDFSGTDDAVRALAFDRYGRIVLAGFSSDHSDTVDFVVARLTATGALDTSFGPAGTGVILTDFAGGDDRAYAVTIQPDDKIVVAGTAQFPNADEFAPQYDFAAARFDADGSLDATFGAAHTGKVTFDLGRDDTAFGVHFNEDESIVLGGAARTVWAGEADFALLRLAPPNVAPVADAGGPYHGNDVDGVVLSGVNSYDPDGSIVKWEWDFDYDGLGFDADASGVTVGFTGVNGPAVRTIALRVTDDKGATHVVVTTVQLDNVAPVANPGGPYVIKSTDSLTLAGVGSVDRDGTIVKYEWDLDYDGSSFDVDAVGASAAFPKSAPGTRTIALRVTDDDGAVHLAVTTVEVTNVAPTAKTDGPRVVTEGTPLTLSGADSGDVDGTVVKYEWDFDYDGTTFDADATGMTASFPMLDGPAFRTVALRVTDNNGGTSVVTTTVRVDNAAPVASLSGPSQVRKGREATFDGWFSDAAGDLDAYEVSWDFGDGTVTGFCPAGEGLSVQHVFDRKGVYTVKFTVRDDDGACSSATIQVEAKAGHVYTETTSSGLVMLTVDGTSAGDSVRVNKPRRSGLLEVVFNGVSEGLFQADRVIIYGTGGNDVIRVDSGVTQPVEVFGGDGNDLIVGGLNDATLHGGGGNDLLFGGAGRNVLDGGDGNDVLTVGAKNRNAATLLGGRGHDVLIGGGGNDLLDGGDGNDVLNGRGGRDNLQGGAGKDAHARDKDDVWSDPDEKVVGPKSSKRR